MKGDFTRFNFGNEARYVSVLNQQGRVSLDSDWNEAEAIDDWQRRQRTIDTLGPFAVIGDNAFSVTYLEAFDDFVITPGRAYVDGHLIEATSQRMTVGVQSCQDIGAAAQTYFGSALHVASPGSGDPTVSERTEPVVLFCPETAEVALVVDSDRIRDGSVLCLEVADEASGRIDTLHLRVHRSGDHWVAEVHDDDLLAFLEDDSTAELFVATTLRTQVGLPAGGGSDGSLLDGDAALVVLDVWQRHRTAVEDPYLLEEALGGPDTTTRVETTWMARLVPVDDRNPTCSDDYNEEMGRLSSPTTGRLSARAIPGEVFTDPCLLPPDAGYRGLQNRLYRVEVHESGDSLADATFKWSEHNGAALAGFTADGTTIEVTDVGRDDLGLGFADLVELFDEQNELESSPGLLLAPRARTDASSRVLEFSEDVSSIDGRPWGSLPRARRWDGLLVDLEPGEETDALGDGISLTFSEGRYRTGDYWLVPARTHSGDIATLAEAPPHGVEHSVAKLAVIDRDPSGSLRVASDCRRCVRPLVDHTETCEPEITVGECGDVPTIPEAFRRARSIARLAVARGESESVTIRLLAGVHKLTGPQVIRQSNVRVTGCGAASRVVCAATSDGKPVGVPAFMAISTSANPVENLTFDNFEIFGASGLGLILASGAGNLDVDRMRIMLDPSLLRPEGAAAITVLDGSDITIVDSVLEGRVALPDVGAEENKIFIPQYGAASLDGADIVVKNCQVRGAGVWIRHGSRRVKVTDNEVTGVPLTKTGSERSGAGVLLGERYPWQEQLFDADGLPDTSLTAVEIRRNTIKDFSWSGVATLDPEAMRINFPDVDPSPVEVPEEDFETDEGKWCYSRLSRAQAIGFDTATIDSWIARGITLPPRPILMSQALVAPSFIPTGVIYLGNIVLSPFVHPADIDISDNLISNCAHAARPDERVDRRVHGGVVMNDVKNVRVNGNQILNNAPNSRGVGIWLDGAFDAELLDNRVEANGRRDPDDKKPPVEDFRSRATPTRVDAAGMAFLGGQRDLALEVKAGQSTSPDSSTAGGSADLIALDAGYPLGMAVQGPVTVELPEATRSKDLAISVLPANSDDSYVPVAVSLADGTIDNIELAFGKETEGTFAEEVTSIQLPEDVPIILSRIEWGPVPVQCGVAVLGAVGARSFGTAGKSSLRVERNVVVCPAGPALITQLLGDGASIVNNTLSSHVDSPLPGWLLRRLGRMLAQKIGACVTVIGDAVQEPSVIAGSDAVRDQRQLHAPLRFSENRVQWSTASSKDGETTHCVALQAADIQFSDNTIEAIVRDGQIYSNVVLASETARIVGNRMSESSCSANMSLQAVLAQRAMVIGNQFDHGVSIKNLDGIEIGADSALNSLNLSNCTGSIFDNVRDFDSDDHIGLAKVVDVLIGSRTDPQGTADAADRFALSMQDAVRYSTAQSLQSGRAVAARFLVKSVAALALARESLEAIGQGGRDLSAAAARLQVADLAVNYRNLDAAVVDIKVPGPSRPVGSGVVLAADGRGVDGATVVLESEDGRELGSVTAGSDGRLDKAALQMIEAVRSTNTQQAPTSKVRFRILAPAANAGDSARLEIGSGTMPPFVEGARLSLDLATNFRLPAT